MPFHVVPRRSAMVRPGPAVRRGPGPFGPLDVRRTGRSWLAAARPNASLLFRSNREIAGRLVISKRTVGAHIEHIYGKIGVSSRVQLAGWLRTRPGE